jgi:hypothetical protein
LANEWVPSDAVFSWLLLALNCDYIVHITLTPNWPSNLLGVFAFLGFFVCFGLVWFWFSEIGSHSVGQASLELKIL